MNDVRISGTVAGDSELRTIASGRQILNFDVCVDAARGQGPIVRVAFFPRTSTDPREIKAGCRVVVRGELRHRRDYFRLFIAASAIEFIAPAESTTEVQHAAQ